jgi:hypothetical protein
MRNKLNAKDNRWIETRYQQPLDDLRQMVDCGAFQDADRKQLEHCPIRNEPCASGHPVHMALG